MNYALYTDENMVIHVIEFPEKPDYNKYHPENQYEVQEDWQSCVEEAKKKAVPVKDQEEAKIMIACYNNNEGGFILQPLTIYEIPGLKVRFETKFEDDTEYPFGVLEKPAFATI